MIAVLRWLPAALLLYPALEAVSSTVMMLHVAGGTMVDPRP
jgi:hypothetical protein